MERGDASTDGGGGVRATKCHPEAVGATFGRCLYSSLPVHLSFSLSYLFLSLIILVILFFLPPFPFPRRLSIILLSLYFPSPSKGGKRVGREESKKEILMKRKNVMKKESKRKKRKE